MGIDKFMNQFNNTFNIAFYIKENKIDNISELIFDFNSIIHTSMNDLFLFIGDKQIDKYEIDDEMINIVSNNFINHIKNTINTNIKCLISIFFDGVPSINKINEQKHRKFHARLYDKLGEKININTAIRGDGKNNWNRNKISPGTDFMIKLCRYFKSYDFKDYLYKNINNVELNIISDTLEIDEAEIKIVRYIKNNYKKHNYIIYSPDADMILLTLGFNKKNINLVRIEYENDNYLYRYVNIDLLFKLLYENILLYRYFILNIDNPNVIEKIKLKFPNIINNINLQLLHIIYNDKNYINSIIDIIKKNKQSFIDDKILKNKYNIINDLILLFIFFGNDFIPKIHTINLNEIEINLFLFYYISAIFKLLSSHPNLKNDNNYHISKKLNAYSLLFIIKELSNIELNYINNTLPIIKLDNKKFKKHDKPKLDMNDYIVKNINPLIIRDHNNKNKDNNFTYFTSIPDNIQYNIDKYNELIQYMSKKYNYINLDKLCMDYINSLHWIKDSYFDGKINNWIYKSIFSPLLSQLYIVLSNNIELFNNFTFSNDTIDQKLLNPQIQFILSFPFDYKDDDDKYYESYSFNKETIKNIKNKVNSLYLLNNNFYYSATDLVEKLITYKNKNKLTNENLINIYHNKNKNNSNSLLNYINNYETFNIYEILCINTRFMDKCHLTSPTLNFIDSKIYELIK